MKKINIDILVSHSFVIGLLILILNDFAFKHSFSNPITGKLSDLAGLFIFPMFLTFLFPERKKFNYILTMVCFILWKLPVSESVINLWNGFGLFSINRVIDYTDYFALMVLPVSYFHQHKRIKFPIKKFAAPVLGVIAFIAFCATAGTHGSMGGYKYPIPKDSLEAAINTIILENEHIERPTLDSTDYYNTGGYITVNIGINEKREYTFRFYGGKEHWNNSPTQSEIFICYAMHNGYAQSEGNDVSDELEEKLVKYFEENFIVYLDEKLNMEHVKTK